MSVRKEAKPGRNDGKQTLNISFRRKKPQSSLQEKPPDARFNKSFPFQQSIKSQQSSIALEKENCMASPKAAEHLKTSPTADNIQSQTSPKDILGFPTAPK